MQTPDEMRTQIVDKAEADAGFRAQLIQDPKATIGTELGVTIPESLAIKVHEETGETVHLVLPPASQLSEGDLQAVAGGRWISQGINAWIKTW